VYVCIRGGKEEIRREKGYDKKEFPVTGLCWTTPEPRPSRTFARPIVYIYRRGEDAVFVVAPVVVGMRLHKLYLVFLDCNRYSFSTSVSSQTTQNLLKGNLRSIY
jgi:hypothetical protein